MNANYYSLDYFKNNSTLYKLSEKYDSTEEKGNNNRTLDGNEITLFNNEVKSLGLKFDFNQINSENYLDEFQIKYERASEDKIAREDLIKNKTEKGEYKIEKVNRNGKEMYAITALKDINCGALSRDLDLPAGVIRENNDGYGQWDYNGHHISNKPMKNVTIYVNIQDIGSASVWRTIKDQIKRIFY